VVFRGSGSATPQRSISNTELGQRVETSDDWIRSRTGIAARRVIGADESLGELNGLAAERALAMAGWSADSLDLILLATSTPDDLFGSAPRLQARIGAVGLAAARRAVLPDGVPVVTLATAHPAKFPAAVEAAFGTGGIVHVAPVSEPLPKAGDHWNIYRIVMDGDHLIVELNNEQTVDVRDDKLVSGPFALQWARGEMRFRKVQIREL